ncbi:hypothetical protein G9C98_000032 [Cotesia typhae]|uniref:Vitellogenin domain-containing protein n=1 Tax=Cotesia typhae TaxID=2053667 RepID=A0A8J5QZP8_9HYME|nr:hypothetical protein G9C98_000032 [Cotesia typhae]
MANRLFIYLLLIFFVFNVPILHSVGSEAKFKYSKEVVYKYQHQVDVNINLGNGSSTSELHIESTISLKFLTPCEAELRVTKTSIRHATRGKYDADFPDRSEADFKEALEHYSLRFAFEDGQVRELCPNSEDPIWAINIKRGILSMLQNTMKRFDIDHHTDELDVNGICDTRYRLHEARKTSLIIKKSKNLNGCSNRGKHLSIIQSNTYASPRTHTQTALVDSQYDCEIVLDHNIYEKVTCQEFHRLQPLSSGDTGVRTEIYSSLVLIEEVEADLNAEDEENEFGSRENEDSKPANPKIIPTNLLYDHSATAFSSRTIHGELRATRDLLKNMCLLGSSSQLEQAFSEYFSKFVHSARFLDYLSLSQLLVRAEGTCEGGRKHVLDALPFIGTSAAVKVMRDAMLKKTITKERSESWITAIALIPRPDASTVAALLPLLELEREDANGHLNLVYSAVVRAFCLHNIGNTASQRQHPSFLHSDDCLSIGGTGIDRFLDHLESSIESGCAPRAHDDEEIKRTLEALKAIGNMGLERDGLLDKLEVCMENKGGFISMETRIAAIDAHRRLPSCQKTRDRVFLPYYRNITLEPEIRIASYLQAMRCPDYNVVKTIKHTLKEEPINQVGSFVWSHLTNLIASSSPTKIQVQSLLSDRDLSDKFNSDGRKYSRNYEKSFFSEEYNVGGTFQANVIFSSKSFVPRTLTFNISLDLFGESVNVIEATVRMEGMEFYIERFFGPNGPFANEEISRHINTLLRSLRSTGEAENYWESLKTLPNIIDNNFNDPRVSFSYKIFGNELEFVMLRGKEEIAKSLASFDPWSKIKNLLSGREIHYEYTGMFLDASYIVPSTAGLPVRLDLSGSGACNFKFSGLLDSERFMKNTEMQLVGNLSPSVSIDITGKMTVDAFYKSASMKLVSNVYSSSAVRVDLDIQGIRLVRLNLQVPNRKLQVFTIQSNILLVNGNGAEITENPALTYIQLPNKYKTIANSSCSWPVVEQLIGLKLCFDYQFPNVTDIANAPYFFLNGPTFLRTSIIKADPSAKSYLFEYTWNATPTDSELRLAFDTPGSLINRESSVTVSFDAKTRNVSVLLKSTGNSLVAKGTYKRTEDETMINIGLDINGTKHLDGYIGYQRKPSNHGFTYLPKLDVRVNDEKIVELSGSVKNIHKNNVTQCDIDLNFQTKKIKSRVRGYIMKRNISLTGNVRLEYQFKNMNKETLQIEIAITNRSSKTLTHKEANLKIQSSAYPELNAIIDTWYQQALGHLELHMEINGKPHLKDDRHKLTTQLVLTYSKAYFQSQEAKMNAFIAISKPIQNIDIKIGIQRFSIGPTSKTYLLIRYAPGKEITLAVNLVIPRGSMFAIEGHANMTIPNLDSLLIDVRITEKARGEYDLDFAGTWFSGHNATIRGTYADRSVITSERRILSHNLKLILRSPSLSQDILFNCKYYRDHVDTKLDVVVEYLDADKYAIKYQNSIISLTRFLTYAEARFKNNVYAVTANIDVEREVRLELHLDNWRDVHLIATGINQDTSKEFGFELKWDANRDPAMKFTTSLQFNKFYQDHPTLSRNLTGTAMISYPGRLFTGSCFLGVLQGHNYVLDAYIDWDPTKNIRITIDADYDPKNWKNYFKFDSQMLTPFEQWKKTSLSARYHWTDQEFKADCGLNWQDNQRFLIQIYSSSQETKNFIEWKADCGLTSTVHSIGWITTNLTHKIIHDSSTTTFDSHFFVNYSPDKVINLRSLWHLNEALNPEDNVTLAGNLRFVSPFDNYKSGDIKCQLRMMSNWKFDGYSSIEIDTRRYTGVLQGDLTRIKESMVQFNITTPLEKYSFVRGRFGLSERNKHVVAELVLPSGPIGVEALCQLFTATSYDFNIMLRFSTPIEALQKFMVITKLAKTEADFRIGYNNITAGFTAVWHYNNLTDFHYSYVLFTPIHGLHESGVVAKLILIDKSDKANRLSGVLDTEFSIRIVETKFGGAITLNDRFVMEDFFDIKNTLEIKTPFTRASEVNSQYVFKVDMENSVYLLDMNLRINKNDSTTLIETGLRGNYSYMEHDEDDSKIHKLHIIFNTPTIFIGYVDAQGTLELDESTYKTSIAVKTNESKAEFVGSLELEEAFFEGSLTTSIDSPYFNIPKVKIDLKKDFFEAEKRLECSIEMDDDKENRCQLRLQWNIKSEDNVKLFVGVKTWIAPLENIEFDVNYDNNLSRDKTLAVQSKLKYLESEYKLSGALRSNGTIDIDFEGPQDSRGFDCRFDGLLDSDNKLTGKLINLRTSKIYNVEGLFDVTKKDPETSKLDARITLTPENEQEEEEPHTINFVFTREKYGMGLKVASELTNGSASLSYINPLNWDVSLQADSPGKESEVKKYQLNAFTSVQVNGNTSVYINVLTPWSELENFQLEGNLLLTNHSGDVRIKHNLNENNGHLNLAWKLRYLSDMFLKLSGGKNDKDVDVHLFFVNPQRAFRNVNVGFDIAVEKELWRCAANTSIGYRDNENIDAVIAVRLPPPNNDDHRVLVSYHAKGGIQDAIYVVGYNAAKAMINYVSDGSIRMAEKNLDAHIRFAWNDLPSSAINNLLNVTFDQKRIGLKYSLYTPQARNGETAIILFNYDGQKVEESIIDTEIYYPARRRMGTAHISYSSLSNINGTLNVTTPMPRFSYAACNFIVLTALKQTKRFVQVFWGNESALFNSDYSYHSERLDSNLEGIVQLEVPLSTRHIAELNYGYKKRPQVTTGHADLIYNKEKIVIARYNSKGESRAGFEKDSIQITLENSYQPLGITYVNQYTYSAGNAGTNYPTVEWRRVNVYRLDNSTAFNIAGESQVKTFHEGQEMEFKAEHLNRTVTLLTDYRVLPGEFDHNCRIELGKDAWAAYKLNIVNKTTEEVDNQFIIINISYPWRNISLDGFYWIAAGELNSEAKLHWNKTASNYAKEEEEESSSYMDDEEDQSILRERTIGVAFLWKNVTDSDDHGDRQMAVFSLKHPGFSKDATVTGHLSRRDKTTLLNASLVVDYSDNPDKLVKLFTVINNETREPDEFRWSYVISGKHPQTRLDLDIYGYIHKNSSYFVQTDHNAKFRRSYLPEETGKLYSKIDPDNYQVEYHRESTDLTKHIDLAYYPLNTEYVVNGSIIDTPKDLNASGALYLNIPEKLTWLMVNYTPDSTKSLRMYGNIPDARNGVFNIWRTYERDLVISDVAFYLCLNHSRLVTSTLKWRPELRNDLTNFVKTTFSDFYNDVNKDLDYWKHYVRSEIVSSTSDIWENAQEDLQMLVEDWNNLKELDEDLNRLKVYLNDSYNNNDFYMKDLMAIGAYVIDELALRSHIDSLPNILNEIWEIMGESGRAIRNSLVWVIEAIKNGYKKLTEIVSAILKGESITQIANIIEKIVEKYDKFIKDLHVSFIKYMENLWNKMSFAITQQWDKILKMIEPMFLRVLHYIEDVLWKASKEVVDFLYDRRNELIKSPYFDRFTNFTQDVDKLYRDIKANDIITNIRKYSAIVINFIRERYFTMVPFGNELKDLVEEIAAEIAELRKLPSINFALEKIHYIYDRVSYFYQYFGVQSKIENAIKIIHSKLMDISQTALQAESKYREAKTKFIFDPNDGLMCLEQKLPMSWHAFNQTPEFQEIPEYRALIDVQNYFTASNTTFWTLYYRYKPYTDPYNWLPPFKAQAMIVGRQHFVTFDGRHYDFAGTKTYLLAHDFIDNQFAVFISYSPNETNSSIIDHKIVATIGEQSLLVDLFNDSIKFADSNAVLKLPIELKNSTGFVYQEESIVTIKLKNNQFKLKCNFKYDVCVIQLSGWFFGKTSGLLGTMNNERWDDTTGSNGRVTEDIASFAGSWSISRAGSAEISNLAHVGYGKSESFDLCLNLFGNQSSEFNDCFMVVEPQYYTEACLNTRSMSEVCTLAISYMQICGFYDTYLRIPDKCTTCTMTNGSSVLEGEFRKLENSNVPNSTDVVFIVEAKLCNQNIRENRSIDLLVTQLDKEFTENNFKDNRWSLVVFGGDGVYDTPRSHTLDSRIFSDDINRFVNYFDNIKVGDGNQDVFSAIGFASQLVFRAGVSKTFILMPCSHCESLNQTLDYSVLHQVLLEHDITLHILMDGDFNFKKQRLNKIFYGLDATKSYTKKDAKVLVGDVDLRRQVKLPKSALGYCTPLSLETNGTIFSGNKLHLDKPSSIKKFANVFAKRVALTAQSSPCQHCECTADNDGVTRMECMPCAYPMPAAVDYVSETFNEDDTYSLLQPLEADYAQLDGEDD